MSWQLLHKALVHNDPFLSMQVTSMGKGAVAVLAFATSLQSMTPLFLSNKMPFTVTVLMITDQVSCYLASAMKWSSATNCPTFSGKGTTSALHMPSLVLHYPHLCLSCCQRDTLLSHEQQSPCYHLDHSP